MTALRLCTVGDSFVLGTGDGEFLGWSGRLAQRMRAQGHDVTLHNLGIRADTSRDIARRWRAECTIRLPAIYPSALVFSFGVNDAAEDLTTGVVRVPHDESVAMAHAIVNDAMAWTRTLWVGPPFPDDTRPPGRASPGPVYRMSAERVGALNHAYAALAGELGVPYLDLFTPLSTNPRWRQALANGDGAHPTDDGYVLIADLVDAWPAWQALFR
jgi:lysophospholipase L1-like esterase